MEKYKLHHFHFFTHNKYGEFLVSNTFRHVALAMVSLFVPIFLLGIGFSLYEVLYFELALLTTSLIFHFINIRLTCYLGLKKTLIISYILSTVQYIILYSHQFLIGFGGKFLYIVAVIIFNAFSVTMFWNAFHLFFIKVTKKADVNKKYGLMNAVPVVFGVISPFLGSFLIVRLGFELTFVFVSVLLGVGSLPLFYSDDIKMSVKYNWKNILKIDNMKRNTVFFVEGLVYVAAGFLWPIFIFLNSIQIMVIGIFYLLSNFFYAAFSYLAGKWSDKFGNERLVKIGAIGFGTSLILRALQKTAFAMSAFQNLGGITSPLLTVPLHGLFYNVSQTNPINSILNRELYMHFGRIFAVALTILILNFFPILTALILGIVVCGTCSFILINIIDKFKVFPESEKI